MISHLTRSFGARMLPVCGLALCLALAPAFAASGAPRTFDIPSGEALATLKQFSAQAETRLLYSVEDVRGITTNRVRGTLTAREALQRLVANTPLNVTESATDGALALSRGSSTDPNGTRAVPTASDRPGPRNELRRRTVSDDSTVQLAAFVVDTSQDRGYAANNAISATKMNTPIKDLPFGVSVLTDDFIRDRNATTTQEAMAFSASYNVDNGNIRGLRGGGNRFRNGFGEFFGRHSLSSVERVEVLKGPSSVLYGITYPGGYVNPITKRPQARNHYEFSAQYGWADNVRALADINHVFTPRVSARLSSEYRLLRSHVEFDENINFVNHAVVTYRPWRNTVVLFDIEVLRSEGWEGDDWGLRTDNDIPIRELFGVPKNYSYNGPDVQAGDDNVIPMMTVTHTWSENFTSELVVNHLWRANRRYDQTRFSTSIVNLPGVAPARRGVRFEWQRITDDTRTWDYQLKNLYAFKTASVQNRVLLQLQLTEATGGRTTFQRAVLPSGATDFYYLPLQGVTNFSALDRRKPATLNYRTDPTQLNGYKRISRQGMLLHQAEIPIGATKLHTIAGGVHYRYNARTAFPTAPTETNVRKKSLPTAGVAWALNDQWTAYGLWSRSFNPNNRNDGFNKPLPPTEGDSVEGGFKVDLWDRRVSGTVSVFQSVEKNRRVNDPEAPNINSFGVNPALPIGPNNPLAPNSPKGGSVAVGEFESKGVDAEAIFTPLAHWQVVASYLFSDAFTTKDPVATNVGRRDANHAEHTAALWTKFTFTQGPLKNLSLGGGYRWSTDRLRFYRVVAGSNVEFELPGNRRLDLFAAYAVKVRGHELFFQANAENLTREKTYVGNRAGTTTPYRYDLPVKWYFTSGVRF